MNSTRTRKLDIALLALLGICFAIVYGINWYSALSFPFAIEYEGTMLWAASTLAQGHNIYDAARLLEAPWAVITYPPLFLSIGAGLVKLFGLGFWCLRLISIVSALISAALLYLIVRRSGCSPIACAIAPAYFMGFTPVFFWANLGRPDMLAVALSLLGLERTFMACAAGLESSASESTSRPVRHYAPSIVAGLAFALACFAKQTSVVCLVSAFLFLIWCKNYRPAVVLAGTAAVGILVLFGATQWLSGGLLQNITIFGTTPWSSAVLARYIRFMSDSDQLRAEICLAVPLFCIIIRKQNTSMPEKLPYVLFALSLAQMLYIMGLPGSNGNHAIFPLMALSWWLALKCQSLGPRFSRVILLAALLALPSIVAYVPAIVSAMPKDDRVLAQVNLTDKEVLSEDPYVNILSHSKPFMIDCAVFTSVWKNHPDKIGQIANAIDHQAFAALVINSQDSQGKEKWFWPDAILQALHNHYKQSGKLNGNGIPQTLWLPK
jgi:4-amino-4-deoxy-L-arabinose transferase-like glycosyltransferase